MAQVLQVVGSVFWSIVSVDTFKSKSFNMYENAFTSIPLASIRLMVEVPSSGLCDWIVTLVV